MPAPHFALLLCLGQEVEQQRADGRLADHTRDIPIAWAVAAAPAPVGKDHHRLSTPRHGKLAFQSDGLTLGLGHLDSDLTLHGHALPRAHLTPQLAPLFGPASGPAVYRLLLELRPPCAQ